MSFALLLEKARHELIDTTLRNPLIKYRWDKTSRGVKRSEKDNSVLTTLETDLLQGNAIGFSAVSDARLDKRKSLVQTDLSAEGLQKRLTKLYREARSFQQEQGFGVLYIAIGFLEWYEDGQSDLPALAPLLLIPVELKRDNDGLFLATYTQEEIQLNVSLIRKVNDDFGIRWPDWSADGQDDARGEAFGAYFSQIEQTIHSQPQCTRWSVHPNRVTLDLFSFAKLAMYEDLNPDRLSETDAPILSTLLTANGSFRADASVDSPVDVDRLTADELDSIVDADSSQTEAIRRALRGHHLVIQGPPGTGKSQTIANLIASLVRQGKKVLFVSEKMAALSVVKRRLDNVGLGQICLELHSHNTRPKEMLAELQRTLQLPGKQVTVSLNEKTNELIDTREKLRAYYQQITQTIGETGYAPYQIVGELAVLTNRYDTATLPLYSSLLGAENWTGEKINSMKVVLTDACRQVVDFGAVTLSPFYGSTRVSISLFELQTIGNQLDALLPVQTDVERLTESLKQHQIPVTDFPDIIELRLIQETLQCVANKPNLSGLADLNSPSWAVQSSQIRELFTTGETVSALRSALKEQVINDAFTDKAYALRQAYQQYGGKWWASLFSKEFKAARQTLKSWCKGPFPSDTPSQRALIDALIDHHEKTEQLVAVCSQFTSLLPAVSAEAFDWLSGREASRYIAQVHADIAAGTLTPWLLNWLPADASGLVNLNTPLAESLTRWSSGLNELYESLSFGQDAREASQKRPLRDQAATLTQMKTQPGSLTNVANWNRHRQTLEQEGLREFVAPLETATVPPDQVYDQFCFSLNAHLLDFAQQQRPLLTTMYSTELARLTTEFSRQESALLRINQARVILGHQQRLPSAPASHAIGEMGVLYREFNKKSRLLPLRRLLTDAGAAVQAIKPVIMMSPLSIARYVPRDALSFDVVIFDEASQVKPVDAFGALMRAKQAIVVGDEHQMPPTSFFDNKLSTDDAADDGEADDQFTQDTESILQLFAGRQAPQTMLKWHYRSRHDSLIQVSNHEFYDDQLIVTPSPLPRGNGLGLRLEPVAGVYAPRMGNFIEAQAIVQAVLNHARTQPKRTLGVVALSTTQMDLIENELDKCRDDFWLAFRNAHPAEPFFVKNLESVQGDERDVIFVSIGFARQADGALRMAFGPVNGEGGHRRLNVLFSRAKEECVIFTGLASTDVRTTESSSRGLLVLKTFLQFAETGQLPVSPSVGSGTESPFEESVKTILERAGYVVDTQIGASGFRIDLGVRDPAHSSEFRYLAGIECDGATYHRSRSARDRDHVRQRVLEGMGWKIYRIWSTDWFHDNARQQQKLMAYLTACRTEAPATQLTRPEPDAYELPVLVAGSLPTADVSLALPYHYVTLAKRNAQMDLHEVGARRLIHIMLEVLQHESPVHMDYLMKRVADAFGVSRIGDRIRSHFIYVFKDGNRSGQFVLDGEFVWMGPPSGAVPVRSREALPTPYRKVEWIAPQEIQSAMLGLLRQNQSVQRTELLQTTMKVLGFQKLTDTAAQTLVPALDALIESGQVIEENDRLRCA